MTPFLVIDTFFQKSTARGYSRLKPTEVPGCFCFTPGGGNLCVW